jgi:hypothetical protein
MRDKHVSDFAKLHAKIDAMRARIIWKIYKQIIVYKRLRKGSYAFSARAARLSAMLATTKQGRKALSASASQNFYLHKSHPSYLQKRASTVALYLLFDL